MKRIAVKVLALVLMTATFLCGFVPTAISTKAESADASVPAMQTESAGTVEIAYTDDNKSFIGFAPDASGKRDPESGGFKFQTRGDYGTYLAAAQADTSAAVYFSFDLLTHPNMVASNMRMRGNNEDSSAKRDFDLIVSSAGTQISIAGTSFAHPNPTNGWHRYVLKTWQTHDGSTCTMNFSLMVDGEWVKQDGEVLVVSTGGTYLYSLSGGAPVAYSGGQGWYYVYISGGISSERRLTYYKNMSYSFTEPAKVECVQLNTNGGTLPITTLAATGDYAGFTAEVTDIPAFYTPGTEYVLPTPTLDYSEFAGWYDNADFTGTPITKIEATDSGAKTFYAKWDVAKIQLTPIDDNVSYIAFAPDASGKRDPESEGYRFYTRDDYSTYLAAAQADTNAAVYFSFDLLTDSKMAGSNMRMRGNGADGTGQKDFDLIVSGDGAQITIAGTKVAHPNPTNGWHRYVLKTWQTHDGSTCTMHFSLMVDGEWIMQDGEVMVVSVGGTYLYSLSGGAPVAYSGGKGWYYVYISGGISSEQRFVYYKNMSYTFTEPAKVEAVKLNTYGGTLPTTAYVGSGHASELFIDAVDMPLFRDASAEYVLPVPTKDGAEFLGWYDDPLCTGTPVTAIAAGDAGAKSFYAKWAGDFFATFSANGKDTVVAGTEITAPDGAAYWVNAAGIVCKPGDAVTLTENTTFLPIEVSLLDGASIRVDAPTGLRFETEVDPAILAGLTAGGYTYRVGTLIVPTDKLGENEFTADALTALGIRYMDLFSSLTDAEDKSTYFATIAEILPANYARAFSAVSYIEFAKDGETVRLYGLYDAAANSRSVYDVACKALKDYESGTAQHAAVKGFIDSVVVLNADCSVKAPEAEGYTAPYTVSYENGTLTITEGGATVKTIVIDGVIYTRGFASESGVITISYTASAAE